MRPAAAPSRSELRLAVAQLWLPVGDLDGNARRIGEAMAWAEDIAADLLVLPELAITGYPPEDLVHHPDFVGENLRVLDDLAEEAGDCVTVVGFVDPVEGELGPDATPRTFANAVALLYRGSVRGSYHKVLLPNYGVFDERRYFAEGRRWGGTWGIHGAEVGVLICEDMWRPDVPGATAADGAQVIVSSNASPYHRGKQGEREGIVTDTARRCGAPVAYSAGVGGQDEVVFDGGSMVADRHGEIVARAPQFAQARFAVDVSLAQTSAPPRSTFVCRPAERARRALPPPVVAAVATGPEEVYRALVDAVSDYVDRNSYSTAIIGLSGGVDSALVATVATDALGPGRVHGVTMPGPATPPTATADASRLAQRLGIRCDTQPMLEPYELLVAALDAAQVDQSASEGIVPSLRSVHLYTLAQATGGIVLATANKTETALGYASLAGAFTGGFAPLKDVPKTLVYALCRWRNTQDGDAFGWQVAEPIPPEIVTRAPSARRAPDRADREVPADYGTVDAILEHYVERAWAPDAIVEEGFDRRVVQRVVELVSQNEATRAQLPPGVKLTSRGFGRDRRLPVTNAWAPRVTPAGEPRTDLAHAQATAEDIWLEG